MHLPSESFQDRIRRKQCVEVPSLSLNYCNCSKIIMWKSQEKASWKCRSGGGCSLLYTIKGGYLCAFSIQNTKETMWFIPAENQLWNVKAPGMNERGSHREALLPLSKCVIGASPAAASPRPSRNSLVCRSAYERQHHCAENTFI